MNLPDYIENLINETNKVFEVSPQSCELPFDGLFSVIVPFRNREKTLEDTLHSILHQAYRPIELILVDNGSEDNSYAIAKNFKETWGITRYTPSFVHAREERQIGPLSIKLLTEPQEGASRARNTGLAAAQGKYVYFFDSDDSMSPEFLADAAARLEADDGDKIQCLTCYTTICLPKGRKRVRRYASHFTPEAQILTGQLSTQSMLLRADFLRSIGGWNSELPVWNDWELGLRVLLNTTPEQIVLLRHKPYHKIFYHSDSITAHYNTPEQVDQLWKALRAAQKLLEEKEAKIGHPLSPSKLLELPYDREYVQQLKAGTQKHHLQRIRYALFLRALITATRLKVANSSGLLLPSTASPSLRRVALICHTLTRLHVPGVNRLALLLIRYL